MHLSRGKRRVLILLAAVAVAVIALVVFTRDDNPVDRPVAESTVEGFATRGSLAKDTDLVEEAADVWREGDEYKVEDPPTQEIELLWAGKVETETVMSAVYIPDNAQKMTDVVVLRSGGRIATLGKMYPDKGADDSEFGDFDGVGIREQRILDDEPFIGVPGNQIIVNESQPKTHQGLAVPLSEDLVDGETVRKVTVQSRDGLISEENRSLILRYEDFELRLEEGQGAIFGSRSLVLEDEKRIWALMSDPITSSATLDALGSATTSGKRVRFGDYSPPRVRIVGETAAPQDRRLLVMSAADSNTVQVSAVAYQPVAKGRTDSVSLGQTEGSYPSGRWVGSAWMRGADLAPFLVVAGGPGVTRIETHVGQKSRDLDTPVGIIDPGKVGDRVADLPPVVIAGFTKDGTVVPAMAKDD